MKLFRPLFIFSILLTFSFLSIINCDETLDTTIKRRRGRPKKVKLDTNNSKILEKIIDVPVTNIPTIIPVPAETTFNEYETYYDEVRLINSVN